MSDLTIKVLEKIHREIRGTNERLDALAERVDTGFAQLNGRLDQTNERIDKTNERLEHVIVMIGSHHSKLEDRVDRIEKHLGLT